MQRSVLQLLDIMVDEMLLQGAPEQARLDSCYTTTTILLH